MDPTVQIKQIKYCGFGFGSGSWIIINKFDTGKKKLKIKIDF